MGSTQEGKLIPKAGIYQNKGFLVQFRVAVFGFRVWSGLRELACSRISGRSHLEGSGSAFGFFSLRDSGFWLL